jgi:hypothetical protein
MKQSTCPYIKISQKEAMKNLANFSFVAKAEAQTNSPSINSAIVDTTSSLNTQLTLPFYFLIISFFLFVILMSGVYMYHWVKFNLNDPFIKSFLPIFFFGIILLSTPLIFNLLF